MISILFTRTQRAKHTYKIINGRYIVEQYGLAKSRVIYGYPRAMNYLVSRITAPTIEMFKRLPAYAGYLEQAGTVAVMKSLRNFASKIGGYLANTDFSTFDITNPAELIALCAILRMELCLDQFGVDLVKYSHQALITQRLIYGIDKNGVPIIQEKFGGISSGSSETNLTGGLANMIVTLYAILKQDPKYYDIAIDAISEIGTTMLVMGDDNLSIFPKNYDLTRHAEILLSDFNMIVHPDKTELGTFFIQMRLNDEDRVIKPMPRYFTKLW